MNCAKRLFAVFSSCLLASACAVALAAAPAQAEGNWFVKGTAIKGLDPTVSWLPDGAPYAFLVPALNLELVFETFEVVSGSLTGEGKGKVELLFRKGKVNSLSPLEPLSCEVGDLLFKLKSNLFLHGEKTYNVLTAAEGTVMTVTTYGGGGCPLTKKNNVTGAMVLEDTKSFQTEAVEHLVRQVAAGLFPELEMMFGANKMSLAGNFLMRLAGAHEGLSWSGVG